MTRNVNLFHNANTIDLEGGSVHSYDLEGGQVAVHQSMRSNSGDRSPYGISPVFTDQISDGYAVYLLNSLIDSVIDQMKMKNKLFKQMISIVN